MTSQYKFNLTELICFFFFLLLLFLETLDQYQVFNSNFHENICRRLCKSKQHVLKILIAILPRCRIF